MTDHDLWSIPICPICGELIHENQNSIVEGDELYHCDCAYDNPEFFDPDESVQEATQA